MICHVIILDMTSTTYTFYERDKTKENKEKQKRRKQIERGKGKHRRKNCRASQQGVWQTFEKKELKKKKNTTRYS